MGDKTKQCPKCGAEMKFRLGEFECAECGYSEPVAKRAGLEPRSEAYRPPAPPPPSATPLPSGQVYRPGEHVPERRPAPQLTVEKLALLGIWFLFSVIIVVFVAAIPDRARLAAEMGVSSLLPWVIFVVVIRLTLLALVLFVYIYPLKWCCASCAVISAIWTLGSLVFGAGIAVTTSAGSGGVLSWVAGILDAAMAFWFASILFRDIQAARGE